MADQAPEKRSYKPTLNLPKTAFPMKANLVQNEPASQKQWATMGLYEKIRAARKGAPPYVFHDGPPYANGSIHLGHLLNKVLKDIVVRSRTMMGFDVPYVPGWDCHGLPIEHKVVAELGAKAREMEPFQIRRKCQAYAEKFVKLQSGQMQRLLTLADYEHPYLTMNPQYEAAALEVFAQLVEKGLVYRALKPVHWSIANQTALADAELEYEDREDTSVYVLFEIDRVTCPPLPAFLGFTADAPMFLMIWTTTPWTLPANLAVAVAKDAEYGIYRTNFKGKTCGVIAATDLAPTVFAQAGVPLTEPLGEFECTTDTTGGSVTKLHNRMLRGEELTRLRYRHPFIDRTSPVVLADYVTLEDGTGLVHTAPGHGVEDYQTGLRERIRFSADRKSVVRGDPDDPNVRADTYCPVREDGTFDDTAPDWLKGNGADGKPIDVWKANDLVVAKLRESGHLFHDHKFTHSYPHDWRSKTPVIFRATEQWFVGVDLPIDNAGSIRERSLAATNDVKFFPDWGQNRLRGMLESRPDWCISRQRAWGLPIPAFFDGKDNVLLTPASVRAVMSVVAQHGSDAWFKLSAEELLASYDVAADPEAPAWLKSDALSRKRLVKGADIFDVWFDSGVSWAAVIRARGLGHDQNQQPITDLYLEGSDQHRGWFQASLLPAIATTGRPPYAAVLTHGFMVDKDGRKMSKSLGNALEVETLLKDHGADVCRWWVSSINTDNDIKVDPEFFKLAGEEYRKVRNTLRYLLSNLYDFAPSAAKPAPRYAWASTDATSIDAWVMSEFDQLIDTVRGAYDGFQFQRVREAIFQFCNHTLSAVYLDATKDRLYCDAADSPRRRRTQAAMHTIADGLIRMIAPILPHTADEAWRALHGETTDPASVHLTTLPEARQWGGSADADWAKVITWQREFMKTIELSRQKLGVDNPLDLGAIVRYDPAEHGHLRRFDPVDLADLCGLSRVTIEVAPTNQPDYEVAEVLDLRQEPRCDRSWKRDGTVKQRSDGGMLSDRDADAIGIR